MQQEQSVSAPILCKKLLHIVSPRLPSAPQKHDGHAARFRLEASVKRVCSSSSLGDIRSDDKRTSDGSSKAALESKKSRQTYIELHALVELLDKHFLSFFELELLHQMEEVCRRLESTTRYVETPEPSHLNNEVSLAALKGLIDKLPDNQQRELYDVLDELLTREERSTLRLAEGYSAEKSALRPEAHTIKDSDERPPFRPCLRGGADSDNDLLSAKARRSAKWRGQERPRTMLFFRTPAPLPDDSQVPRGLWWLAGGSLRGKVPTAGELRQRRRIEAANRDAVGFWGTLFGVRSVKRLTDLESTGSSSSSSSGEGSEHNATAAAKGEDGKSKKGSVEES